MADLIIHGDKNYVKKLEAHLHKEHPSTKNRTKIQKIDQDLDDMVNYGVLREHGKSPDEAVKIIKLTKKLKKMAGFKY